MARDTLASHTANRPWRGVTDNEDNPFKIYLKRDFHEVIC